jgi:hypothetical protein
MIRRHREQWQTFFETIAMLMLIAAIVTVIASI